MGHSSHSLAAAKRDHPVRAAAKFTPPYFGAPLWANHFRRSTSLDPTRFIFLYYWGLKKA
jgi:hypothetical protein